MRITFPNPLGPPITLNTEYLNSLYERLPLPTPGSSSSSSSRGGVTGGLGGLGMIMIGSIQRRPLFKLLLVIFGLVVLFTIHPKPPFPPTYTQEWKNEASLARTRGEGGVGEGKNGRYVKFDVPRGTGFNHQMLIYRRLQHHLAVLGNRSLAFEPYVEDDTYLPFVVSRWPWRSARIPLSAYISTVVSGFEKFYKSPRAVPAHYYRNVCPTYKEQTHTIQSEFQPEGDLQLVADGQSRIHQIQVLLAGSEQSCVRISGEPFDDDFFDSPASLDLYDTFVKSPVMKHFSFSPTVLDIINRNLHSLAPEAYPYDLDAASRTTSTDVHKTSSWKHILAMHLRRGHGWEAVCEEKGRRAAPFVSFNKLPKLPGNENVPPPESMVEATRMGLYKAKCLPETLDIIARARRMRKNHPLLKSVYILTDADDSWIREIRMWLQSEGWDNVWIGRHDIYPDWQDKEVGVAVDMEIARRAGVFVGNGFSTTSSNIVLLRSRDGIHPDLTQFW
ncbi:uncharacterized protein I303_106878 [Kwoniella dejecticola CBS 10117]|uniref:O-fucosyltransferase family protein n=1 Tax=Kwoniella dejecticola CBS 10117 TaxID=1296121 RepID=A0A1A5ZTK0_9TREE|nr:uncharacterized protein I303_08482 [Kwoniella dejecticola CBS 10117]OBR81100.1 hypothetical protein I303_08482 [Kwoniella dejecticola CBS 10117]